MQLKIAVPVLLSAALLAFVFSIADLPQVGGYLASMSPALATAVLGITIGYLLLKWAQFHSLLASLRIPVTWRQSMVAFVIGEMALPIPAGIFAQNYLLQRISGADFSRSSGATTAVLVSEGTVALISVAVLGIPGWDVLRYMILGLFALAAVVIALLVKVKRVSAIVSRVLEWGPVRKAGASLEEIVRDAVQVLLPAGFTRTLPVSATYLFALALGFFLTAHGIGLRQMTFLQAAAIYLFAVAIVLVNPVSAHLGIIEAGGVGAMQQFGYSSTEALATLLAFRVLWTGSTWLIGGTALLALRGEFTERTEKA